MKIPTQILVFTAAALLPTVSQAQQLQYSFETSANGWGTTANFAPTGPATDGVASAKSNAVAGGWNLGAHAFNFGGSDLNGDSINDNVTMAAIDATGLGTVSFDVIIDHATSFPAGGGTWYSINFAANSVGGWTQFENIHSGNPSMGWHDDSSTGILTVSLSYTFAQLNWDGVGVNWYQMNLGTNSDGAKPVNFYVDNIVISAIPEPSTYGLFAGLLVLGCAAGKTRRRRISA